MKAYVIKNKEGEYFMDNICFANFSPYIQNATYYHYKPECIDIIEERLLDGCTIVPITICEGDLEEEIGILKGFAYKLFREKYDDIPEKRVREWFDDALKDTKNFIQQAKESEKDERN